MAEPIPYRPGAPSPETTAQAELERLLETLHRQGVLRLANDLVGARDGIAEVLMRGLNAQGTRNAMQNLAVLAAALAQVPPERFHQLVAAFQAAAARLVEDAAGSGEHRAPGVSGTWKMLKDDAFWQAISPLLEALKAFSGAMRDTPPEQPITAYSGKPTDN
jgi:uncharacterized protein YjgD (DUF1641 family)